MKSNYMLIVAVLVSPLFANSVHAITHSTCNLNYPLQDNTADVRMVPFFDKLRARGYVPKSYTDASLPLPIESDGSLSLGSKNTGLRYECSTWEKTECWFVGRAGMQVTIEKFGPVDRKFTVVAKGIASRSVDAVGNVEKLTAALNEVEYQLMVEAASALEKCEVLKPKKTK